MPPLPGLFNNLKKGRCMKSTFLTTILIIILACISFAQEITSRKLTIPANDSTVTFTVPEGYQLAGLEVDTLETGTDSLIFYVNSEQGGYIPLWYEGSAHWIVISAPAASISFNTPALSPYADYQLVLCKKQTAIRIVYPRYVPRQ
jgi:hypothetical protein